MLCELCGREIKYGESIKIEGAVITVCKSCAKMGVRVGKVSTENKPRKIVRRDFPEEDIVIDYAERIRSAREKLNLKQEELARKINEKDSVIARIESGKMIPSMELAKKLEKFLKISLIEIVPPETPLLKKGGDGPLTLGDVVKIKHRARVNQ